MENSIVISYKSFKQWLGARRIRELAEQHGIGIQQARAVLNQRASNSTFLEAVLTEALENKQRITSGLRQFQSI